MKRSPKISCLLVDIGGVLMTNGWDHEARIRASLAFKLDPADVEQRNHLVAGAYEEGHLTLEEYLDYVVFHRKRSFSRERFRSFVYAQSKVFPDMLALVARLKARHSLRIAVVSNEGREINAHRVKLAGLDRLVDAFISSSFVHLRKPDLDLYRLALDIVQTPAERTLYIENTALYVQAAAELGIRGILHKKTGSTRAELAALGLT